MSDRTATGQGGDDPDLSGFGFGDGSWESHLAQARRSEVSGTLGEFRLVELIGRGGQGAVYRAVQPGTERPVAIKRIALTGAEDERRRDRFRREVELAASLRHPGIVTIHGLIDGDTSVVMEWIDGRDAHVWGDVVREMEGGVRRIVGVVRGAAEAIAYAHARGVIHRDLKPSNILIDANDGAHVVDFGLARAVGRGGENGLSGRSHATMTVEGSFVGTPVYASPEHIDLGLHETDVRADVYAMGAVLHRLLSGIEPFESPTLAGLFDQIRRGDPAPPSTRNAGVDGELDAIVMMAMRPRREDRYQTMEAFAEDLARWSERRAVRAVPTSTVYLARAFVRRHRVGVGLGVAAVGLIAGSGVAAGAAAWSLGRERAALRKTIAQRDAAAAEADTQRTLVQTELGKSMTANMGLMSVIEKVGKADPAQRRALADGFWQRASALDQSKMPMRIESAIADRLNIAKMLMMLDERDKARELLERVVDVARRRMPDSQDLSEAMGSLATIAFEERRYADAVVWCENSHEWAQRVHGMALSEFTRAGVLYARALAGAGRTVDAQQQVDAMVPAADSRMVLAESARMILDACREFNLRPPPWATAHGDAVPPSIK